MKRLENQFEFMQEIRTPKIRGGFYRKTIVEPAIQLARSVVVGFLGAMYLTRHPEYIEIAKNYIKSIFN